MYALCSNLVVKLCWNWWIWLDIIITGDTVERYLKTDQSALIWHPLPNFQIGNFLWIIFDSEPPLAFKGQLLLSILSTKSSLSYLKMSIKRFQIIRKQKSVPWIMSPHYYKKVFTVWWCLNQQFFTKFFCWRWTTAEHCLSNSILEFFFPHLIGTLESLS